MNEDKSQLAENMENVALVLGAAIGIAALAISAYRQYVLVLGTLPQSSDLLVQALPFLAPFCVEGFIVYSFIRLRYTRPKTGELTVISIYGVLMILVAIVSNIIESNISMGLTITDQTLATVLHVIVPSIPVATGLMMMAIHLLSVQGSADGVIAADSQKFDKAYQKKLAASLASQRETEAGKRAELDASAILAGYGASLALVGAPANGNGNHAHPTPGLKKA